MILTNNLDGRAQTIGNTSYINSNQLRIGSAGNQMGLAVLLAHEAGRDGRSSANQQGETSASVKGHWRYQEMLGKGRFANDYLGSLDQTDQKDYMVGKLYQEGKISAEDAEKYIAGNYDSNGDYWKVASRNEHGNITGVIEDGKLDFKEANELAKRYVFTTDKNGEIISKLTEDAIIKNTGIHWGMRGAVRET